MLVSSEIAKLQPREVVQAEEEIDSKMPFLDEKTRVLYLGKPIIKRSSESILTELVKVLKVMEAKRLSLYDLLYLVLLFRF